jgi:hypothetical protein
VAIDHRRTATAKPPRIGTVTRVGEGGDPAPLCDVAVAARTRCGGAYSSATVGSTGAQPTLAHLLGAVAASSRARRSPQARRSLGLARQGRFAVR